MLIVIYIFKRISRQDQTFKRQIIGWTDNINYCLRQKGILKMPFCETQNKEHPVALWILQI